MTEAAFRAKRRQKFLTEQYFLLNGRMLQQGFPFYELGIASNRAKGDFDCSGQGGICKDRLKLLRLRYTAGEPIETLKPLYADVVDWLGRWHRAYDEYRASICLNDIEKIRTGITPLWFEDLFCYQLALDVVSLGVLLGEGDFLRTAVAWMESARGTDLLFESIIAPAVADPRDNTDFFHEVPYEPLIDTIYTAKSPAETADFMRLYLDGWYKAFRGAPWHNGHLVATDEYSNYEGYWAFDAAAICVIYGIDDSDFRDHLVYPKDLADWARASNSLERVKPGVSARTIRMRCDGGQHCPQAGVWYTPATPSSRRAFEKDELMPTVEGSPWGTTIWYWDERQ